MTANTNWKGLVKAVLSAPARWAQRAWDRTMEWAGRHPAVSWYIHGSVCWFAAGCVAWIGHWMFGRFHDHAALFALVLGSFAMMAYYLRKELGDWAKYRLTGRLKEISAGVSREKDGWGDLAAPVFFLIGVLSGWFWS